MVLMQGFMIRPTKLDFLLGVMSSIINSAKKVGDKVKDKMTCDILSNKFEEDNKHN